MVIKTILGLIVGDYSQSNIQSMEEIADNFLIQDR